MNFLQRKYWQTSYLSHRIKDSFPWILKMKTGVDFMILFQYPRKMDTIKNCRYFFLKRADTITFSEALGPKKYELGKQKESVFFLKGLYLSKQIFRNYQEQFYTLVGGGGTIVFAGAGGAEIAIAATPPPSS